MTPEDVMVRLAGVRLPKADTAGVRTVAAYYRQIADAIDSGKMDMDAVARQVMTHNEGAGFTAFDASYFGAGKPGARGTEPLTAYPSDVSAYVRKLAKAHDDFAHVSDEFRKALRVQAFQLYANIVFTVFYGWETGFIEGKIIELIARIQAFNRVKDMLIGIIIKRLAYMLTDSLAYAGKQQGIQYLAYRLYGVDRNALAAVTGHDQLSAKENRIQFIDGFVGNIAFDTVADLLPGLKQTGPYRENFGKYFLRQPGFRGAMQGFTTRMLGSNAYTMASNATDAAQRDDNGDWTLLPTPEQEVAKVFIHVPRMLVKYPLRWKNWPSIPGQVPGLGTP